MQTHFLPSKEDVFFVNPFRKTDNRIQCEIFVLFSCLSRRQRAHSHGCRPIVLQNPHRVHSKVVLRPCNKNTTGTGTPVSSSVDGRTTNRNIQTDDPDLKTSQKNGCGDRSSSRYSAFRPDPNIESYSIIRARPNNSVR